MLKVKFWKKYYEQVNYFLKWYKNSFKNLYTDTWIDNEYFFHKWYIENAKKIKNEVKLEIIKTLEEEIIWYRLYDNWKKSIQIYIKSFMLEVFFEEDIEEKIRFIENIIINKK